jgi:glycosyltransferase involved in cell wall biosynthesis
MRRYADLVESALSSFSDIQVQRIGIAPADPPGKLPSALRTLWHHAGVAGNARRLRARRDIDLFHVIDGSRGYVASCLPPGRTIVTVHDLIPWLQSERYFPVPPPSRAARWIVRRAAAGLGDAKHLVCDSTATQTDLLRAIPSTVGRSCVVFPPLEPAFIDAAVVSSDVRPAAPFVFHVGNNAFYKNRRGVLEVFSRIAPSVPHNLIMAGPAPTIELKDSAQSLGIKDRVAFIENPTDDEVRTLYRTASLFLFPSRYEGFGWPPLEAMASGCPVVCSHAGSLGEVVDTAALTAAADDTETLAKHCVNVLADPATAESLRLLGHARATQFGLDSFGQRLVAVYRQAVHQDLTRSKTASC